MTVQIQVLTTRSENLVTFRLDRELVPPGTGKSFSHYDAALEDPVAKALFEIPGVKSVWMLGHDLQVTKAPEARWSRVQSQVIEAIQANIDSR